MDYKNKNEEIIYIKMARKKAKSFFVIKYSPSGKIAVERKIKKQFPYKYAVVWGIKSNYRIVKYTVTKSLAEKKARILNNN